MRYQPTALRLAQQLEAGDIHECAWQAAAELRRINAECNALAYSNMRLHDEKQALEAVMRQALEALDDSLNGHAARNFLLQRDAIAALREALGDKA